MRLPCPPGLSHRHLHLHLLLAAWLSGCAAGAFGDGDGVGEVPCDVTLSEAELNDFQADGGVFDAGLCTPEGTPIERGDVDGGPNAFNDAAICADLVTKTCGAGQECAEDPGCVAANLQARFEPTGCDDALGDARSFPACSLGTCDQLATKVCGGEPPGGCENSPGCAPSRELQRRVDDGDVSAEQSCAAALADETLFPTCS